MLATVIDGRKIGRELGFPTANLALSNPAEMPENGVYAVDVVVKNEKFLGILNVGNRPTFGTSERTAEVHILDFSQEIYGETLEISVRRFIREERFFDNPEDLRRQIEQDIIASRSLAYGSG